MREAFFILLLFVIFVGEVYADTHITDGSSSDVQAKINLSVDGDTVVIPAGSFTWSSGVTISGKGITLRGAGGGRIEGSSSDSASIGTGSKSFSVRSGSTIIGFTVGEAINARHKHEGDNFMSGTVTGWDGSTLDLNVTSVGGSGTYDHWVFTADASTTITHNAGADALINVTKDDSNNIRLRDFRLVEGTGNGNGILVGGSGEQVLISDVRISNIPQGIRLNCNGCLIWNCYFDAGFDIGDDVTNNDNGIIVTATTPAWDADNSVGGNDSGGTTNTYIEECYFMGLVLGCVDASDLFRGSVRNSVLDNSGITTHGQDTSPEGVRHIEIVDNLMIFDALPEPSAETANMSYWVTWRGGSGIFQGNEVDDISSWAWGDKSEISLEYQPLRRNAGVNACYSGSYPAPRQPGQGHNGSNIVTEGLYIYTNTGTVVAAVSDYTPNECGGSALSAADFIVQGRDYFESAPSLGHELFGYSKFDYPHPLRLSATATATSATAGSVNIGN